MYDELKRSDGDNPTIGIVLCSDTDEDIARYSVLHGVSPVIHRYMRSVEIDGDKGSREASFVGRGRGRGYQNLYRLISYRTAGGCCAYSRKIEYGGSSLKIH